MYYISDQVMEMFAISRETVRNWSAEFADYLSPTANPAKGQTRQYTYDDLEVFALVADLKKQRWKHSDIHPLLQNGQRGTPPIDDLPDLYIETESDNTTIRQALAHAHQRLEIASNQIKELQTNLATTEAKNTELEKQIAVSQAERNQALKQIESLTKSLQEATMEAYRRGFEDGKKSP